MICPGRFRTGPRGLDSHVALKVSHVTLCRYQAAAKLVCEWCDQVGLVPNDVEEWDDLLIEFKNSWPDISKSKFTTLVAAVEFYFPRFRGQLQWSHAALRGWSLAHPTKHTVPLMRSQAALVGLHVASLGFPRLLGGLLLQQRKGLRPGELLALRHEDVVLPEEQLEGPLRNSMTVGLGIKSGTKAKRPQSVVVLQFIDPDIVQFMRVLKSVTRGGERLFPFSFETFRRLLKTSEARLGVRVGWTPHSARAGYASEAKAAGIPFEEIRETGRWVADSSLRIYIDIVGAAAISTQLKSAGLEQALAWALKHWPQYCSAEQLAPPAWGHAPKRC